VLVCFASTALVLVPATEAALRVLKLEVLLSEEEEDVVLSGPEASLVVLPPPLPLPLSPADAVLASEVVVDFAGDVNTGFVAATAGHVAVLATLIVASGM
jgi:hypothetical protein